MAKLMRPANTKENNEKMGDFSPIPAGDYNVVITDSPLKETKAGTGHYINLKMKIINGQHKGRLLFDIINIDNPNQEAVKIANKTLNTLASACDLTAVEDSEEFHGIPITAEVFIVPASGQYPERNGIRKYKKCLNPEMVGMETEDEEEPAKKLPWEK